MDKRSIADMTRVLWLILAVFITGCAAVTSNRPPSKLRFDGVYSGGNYPYGCVVNGSLREFYPKLWDLLRFYPDGTVIEESGAMFLTPSNSETLMAKENRYAKRRGNYTVEGNRISFVTTEHKGNGRTSIATDPIRSSGRIEGDRLILKRHRPDAESGTWWSKIAGESVEYRFRPY
jgi:hypothetical protein